MQWKIFNGRQSIIFTFLYLLMSLIGLNNVSAQTIPSEDKWGFLVEPYLMFPYISGDIGIENLKEVQVDADPSDIFNNLHMAAMLYLEAKNNEWAITSDLVYMNLQKDVTPTRLIRSGTVTLKQTIWEVAGLYRVIPYLEVGIGGRLNVLTTDLDAERNVLPEGSEELTGHHSVTFFDPILITRLTYNINGEWLFQFRGDLGGFGVGSDFTWQLQGYAGYRFSELFQLSAGYRILSTDYETGDYEDQFIFNVNEFGPVIRFGFNF